MWHTLTVLLRRSSQCHLHLGTLFLLILPLCVCVLHRLSVSAFLPLSSSPPLCLSLFLVSIIWFYCSHVCGRSQASTCLCACISFTEERCIAAGVQNRPSRQTQSLVRVCTCLLCRPEPSSNGHSPDSPSDSDDPLDAERSLVSLMRTPSLNSISSTSTEANVRLTEENVYSELSNEFRRVHFLTGLLLTELAVLLETQ